MKEWKNPQISVLGVESTESSWGKHDCHREPGQHSGNCSSGKGHTPVLTGQCEVHTTTVYSEIKDGVTYNYSCCCLS